MTIEEVFAFEEMQVFERKSINIEPKALATPLVAFANADGGTLAIGISDKTKRIEGIDFETQRLNELLRVPFDFCNPTIMVQLEKVPCIDYKGRENHVLLMHIDPSPQVHANQADEVYLRIGDKSKLLKFEERLQLTYDKGERYFEDKPVPDASIGDIDIALVNDYIDKIGYGKTAIEFLKENKGFVKERNENTQISTAAILLFGKNPQNFFPRARVRFIRYEGIEEKFGSNMNVIKDIIFEGPIPKILHDSIAYLDTQIKEKTYLNKNGTFVTEEEYPKFVRQELIVNAITHRAYSIRGTDIQIKMFDDHITVESPGKLPGPVKTDNMRYTHFSRNPKIAEYLKTYNFVKEYGEGVDRMCSELETAGLKIPEYHMNAFMLQATIYNNKNGAIDTNNGAIDTNNGAIDENNGAIDENNVAIGRNYGAIGKNNGAIDEQKVTKDIFETLLSNSNYNEPTLQNLLAIYSEIETNQIFGASEVAKILDYSYSGARKVLAKLLDLNVLTTVKGKGKGKYRFLNNNELEKI